MFRITFLGTADGMGEPNRDNTYFLVQHLPGATAYLVDCGGAPWSKLAKTGVRPDDLMAVFVTHAHPDHLYGLPALVQSLWLAGRKTPLQIVCPVGVEGTVRGLLNLFDLFTKPGMFPIEIKEQPLEVQSPVIVGGGLSITTFPALHGVPTIGLIFTESGIRGKVNLVYSADTAYNPLLENLANQATCLIHECSGLEQAVGHHSSFNDVVRLVKKTNPKQVVLVHLAEGEDYENGVNQVRMPNTRFILAEDGMSLRIS
ncbi:MAG: ribonuclease Z [Heliobacteriaceae bacterium]|nr:ribonuclease Z [Heliobacteriaceae bacterium]MDD4587329.1 ribonuclease Z [Heliobacteriaceae bacterium]